MARPGGGSVSGVVRTRRTEARWAAGGGPEGLPAKDRRGLLCHTGPPTRTTAQFPQRRFRFGGRPDHPRWLVPVDRGATPDLRTALLRRTRRTEQRVPHQRTTERDRAVERRHRGRR